jgi:Ran GTPase-activating protein (RanGAP) involved in mRNA processing and transport
MNDIVFLNFSGNEIGYDGVEKFVENVVGHPSLKVVNLTDNAGIAAATDEEKRSGRNKIEKLRVVHNINVAFLGL